MKKSERGIQFWNRVDELRGNMSIRILAEKACISEKSLQVTRSLESLPKMQTVYPLAQTLGTTMEYLYAGIEKGKSKDEREEDPSIGEEKCPDNQISENPIFQKIASSQLLSDITSHLASATPEEIEMVRRILNVPKPSFMQ